MNLHAQIIAAPDTADFTLLISATGVIAGTVCNVATIASIPIDDPNLQVRLRDIAQAFRMGTQQ